MRARPLVSIFLSVSVFVSSINSFGAMGWEFPKRGPAVTEPKVCFDILTRNDRMIAVNTKLTREEIAFAHEQAKRIYNQLEEEKRERILVRSQWNFLKSKVTKASRWFNGLKYYAYYSTKGIPQKIRRVIRGGEAGSSLEYVREKVIGEAEAYPTNKLHKITEGVLNLLYLRKIKKFLNTNAGEVGARVAILTEYPYFDSETGKIGYHKRTFAGLSDLTRDIKLMGISNPDIKIDSKQFTRYLNRKYLNGLHTTQAYLIGVLRIMQKELRSLDEARAKEEWRKLLDRITYVIGDSDDRDAFDRLGEVFSKIHNSEDFVEEVEAMLASGVEHSAVASEYRISKYRPPVEYVYRHKSRVWFAEFLYSHGFGGSDELENENRKLRDSSYKDLISLGTSGEKFSIWKKGMTWMISLMLTAALANYAMPVAESVVKLTGDSVKDYFPTVYVVTLDGLEWVGVKDSMYLYTQKQFLYEANKRILAEFDIDPDISFENWKPEAQKAFIKMLTSYEKTENLERREQITEKNLLEYQEKYSRVHNMIDVVAEDSLNWKAINKYLRAQKVFLADGQLDSLKKSFEEGAELNMVFLGGSARQIISEMYSIRQKYVELRKNDQNNRDQIHAELHFLFTVNDTPYYNSAL